MSKQKYNSCTQHVVNLYFSGNSMHNLLLYCGLTDARIRASEKDLPVSDMILRLTFKNIDHALCRHPVFKRNT